MSKQVKNTHPHQSSDDFLNHVQALHEANEEKFYVYLEDENKYIEDPNYSSYNLGTQEVLSVIDDMDGEFESFEHYKNLVSDLEKCKNGDQVNWVMEDYGSDYVDELEIGNVWMDIMFPRPEKSEHLSYE